MFKYVPVRDHEERGGKLQQCWLGGYLFLHNLHVNPDIQAITEREYYRARGCEL